VSLVIPVATKPTPTGPVLAADATSLAIELLALVDGLQLQWLLAPDKINMAAQLRQRLEGALTAPLPLRPPL